MATTLMVTTHHVAVMAVVPLLLCECSAILPAHTPFFHAPFPLCTVLCISKLCAVVEVVGTLVRHSTPPPSLRHHKIQPQHLLCAPPFKSGHLHCGVMRKFAYIVALCANLRMASSRDSMVDGSVNLLVSGSAETSSALD